MVKLNENYRVPLDIRNPVQVQTAISWSRLREAEQMDCNTVLMAWARLFASLFAELCDKHRVDPYVFRSLFTDFQESITEDVQVLKWAASAEQKDDVGYEGVAGLIARRVEDVYESGERRGVVLTLVFPHIGEGGGEPVERTVFFPDKSEEPAEQDVLEWVI